MKNITIIDNKQFLNDYVEFEEYRNPQTWERYKRPTLKCFIHVWQKCDEIKEFWEILEKLHHVFCPNSRHSLKFHGQKQRADYYRRNGVEIKNYRWSNWTPNKEKKRNELNRLAKLSLQ